ncbi:leucine-rich repeat and transmembrane domain-containing protein 2-like [Periplaneta americana]|uniref:leucine-rich repeat and transmembrane domain-containing protein 2-like n=1 Tax=Periplaneta americana TaxID=6978 RepID=UPI0037E88E3A
MIRLLLLWSMAPIVSSNFPTDTPCSADPPCRRNEQCDTLLYKCTNITLTRLTRSTLPPLLNVKSLRDLRMTRTEIIDIDEDFFSDKEDLQRLFLTENKLKSLHYTIFKPLIFLEYLDLSHNMFESLDSRLFSAQNKLQILKLSNNNLNDFHEAALFSNLIELISLDLSYNQISFLSENLFYSLKKLEKLFLISNKMSSFSESLVSPLRSLKELYAEGNKFICNCELYSTVMMLDGKVDILRGTCRCPKAGYEIYWLQLNENAACGKNGVSKTIEDNNTQRTTDILTVKVYESPRMSTTSPTTEYASTDNTTQTESSATTQLPNTHRNRRGYHGISDTILIVVLTLMALQMACCIFGALWYWKKKFGSSRKRRQEILVDNEIRRNNEYEYEYVISPSERAINLPELPARPIACMKENFSKFPNNFNYEKFSSPQNESTLKNSEMCETYDYAYEGKPNSLSVKNNLVGMSNVGAASGNETSGQELSVRATQKAFESCDKTVQEDRQYEAIEQVSDKHNGIGKEVMVENILYSEN